jgi:hypothetical protein
MSSTNRGYNRHIADYYVTPKYVVKDFLSSFLQDENIDRPDRMSWLDPCCGGDENNEATYLTVINDEFEPKSICGIDIRQDSRADVKMDFLQCEKQNMLEHDIVISNPPFYLAEQFIRKSIEFTKNGGYVIMLLRLNFFGSQHRKQLFDEFMPYACYVHMKRINFISPSMKKQMESLGKKTPTGDSIEYAHFVWKIGENNNFCKTFII